MKLALCLYGPYRHFNNVAASLRTHLFSCLNIDLFACVYDASSLGMYPADSNHPRYTHKNPVVFPTQRDFSMLSSLCPLQSETFSLDSPCFSNSLAQLKSNIGSVEDYPLAMWANLWAQERVVEMASCFSQKYDFVIVSRADVIYQNNLPQWCFDFTQLTVQRKFGCGSACDFWFMGNSSTANQAGKRFSCLSDKDFHPHKAFDTHLKHHNIEVCFADLPLNVVQRRYTGWWYTPYIPDPDSLPKVIS